VTETGRWALRLELGGIGLVALGATIVATAEIHAFGALALVGLLLVIGGGGCAVLAVIRDDERSRLVMAALLPALLALFLVIGELAFPH